MKSPSILRYLVVTALIFCAPAFADVEFTSQPPTSASVGRAYSYRMVAAIIDEDDDEDEDDAEDGRCLIWSPDVLPGAPFPVGDCEEYEVPTGFLPSPGDCRIWYPDVPPGQQPPPFDCDEYDDDEDDDGDIIFIARALPRWLEFDGEDTIYGTPRQEDVGAHRVRLRARLEDERVDQDFLINVDPLQSDPPAEGADLAVSISVTPELTSIGDPVAWRATARNLADTDVANIVLEVAFFGDASLSIDEVDDSSCSIEPRGNLTAMVCRWSPFASGTTRSAQVLGRATGIGDVLAVASVSIVDTVPIDRNSDNDDAAVVLRVSDGSQGGIPGGDSPVLSLIGPSTVTVVFGDTYEDPGASAMDDADGNLTAEINVDNPVDTNVIGRYSVTYDVADSAGNMSTVTRIVEVVPQEGAGGGGGGAAGIVLVLLALFGIYCRRTRVLVH